MGKLLWHDLSRLISIAASICEHVVLSHLPPSNLTTTIDAVWASFWGILFRKFFWDFIGGVLRNPGGLQSVPPSL